SGDDAFFDGPPVLAVEVLSPSDKQENVDDKVATYLAAGVAIVWVVNPRFRTVMVYRPDAPPCSFNDTQELTAEPHLPGFRVAVAGLFGGWRVNGRDHLLSELPHGIPRCPSEDARGMAWSCRWAS